MAFQDVLYNFSTQLDGDISTDIKTLDEYSTDASPFRIPPSAVVYPKNSSDIQKLVIFANKNKALYPELSLTVRGGGTCLSGGPINNSIIIDVTRYMSKTTGLVDGILTVEPGVYMDEVEILLDDKEIMIAAAPTSRVASTIGGMVSNNSGGEFSHRYGNMVNSVREITAVLADGSKHTFKSLTKVSLQKEIDKGGFVGDTYRELYNLLRHHGEDIHHLRPRIRKNSTGYNLWDVYDEKTKTYNFAKLLCGSQGTLGIITSIKLETQPKPKNTIDLIAYIENTKNLDKALSIIDRSSPLSIAGFNDIPLRFIMKHFSNLRLQFGAVNILRKSASRINRAMLLRNRKLNIVLMVKIDSTSTEDLNLKNRRLKNSLEKLGVRAANPDELVGTFWKNRQASMSFVHQKVIDGSTIPFLDDMAIEPRYVSQFIKKLQSLIHKYNLPATISGNFGDGNFKLTPVINQGYDRSYMYESVLRDISKLTSEYGGTLAGENNDGLVRGPWLRATYGDMAMEIFNDIKRTFDPMLIFNPQKKTDASLTTSRNYIKQHSDSDQLIVLKNN